MAGSVKVRRPRSVAAVSKMPKRTWQLNYKRRSKEYCVSILREVRAWLRQFAAPISQGNRGRRRYIGRTCAHLSQKSLSPARRCGSRQACSHRVRNSRFENQPWRRAIWLFSGAKQGSRRLRGETSKWTIRLTWILERKSRLKTK